MKTELNSYRQIRKSVIFFLILMICFSGHSQLKGGHILGAMGLQAGTQTPENTLSVYIPGYIYSASTLRDANGNKAPQEPDFNMYITGAGASYVSDFKILGANYGAGILLAFAANTIQGNSTNVDNSMAFTDMYLVPIQLGWHHKRADFVFSYQLYLPTGKFEAGASDNSGLGMFMNEFSGGTTLYFNDKKTFHFFSFGFL